VQETVTKYVKPKSITWWASVFPLLAGLLLAVATAIPGLDPLAATIQGLFPETSATALINMGLVGVGLRGAIK